MKPNVQLPPIFAESNICELEACLLRTSCTPPRTIGSSNFSTQLSGMRSTRLDLQLDGVVYSFVDERRTVRYLGQAIQTRLKGHAALPLEPCNPKRVIAIRRIVTKSELTLLLLDETIDKPIIVIGDVLTYRLEGIDVTLTTINGTTLHVL